MASCQLEVDKANTVDLKDGLFLLLDKNDAQEGGN
jgi:hypothetical protein